MPSNRHTLAVSSAVALLSPLLTLTGGTAHAMPFDEPGTSLARVSGSESIPAARPGDPPRMQRAWQRWLALNEGDYNLIVDRRCYCMDRRGILTKVRDGEIVSVTRLGEPGQQLDRRGWTMARLFRMLHRSFEDAAHVGVRFDERGVPHDIFVDWFTWIADDERLFVVKLRRI
jgi:hypothetical protein